MTVGPELRRDYRVAGEHSEEAERSCVSGGGNHYGQSPNCQVQTRSDAA